MKKFLLIMGLFLFLMSTGILQAAQFMIGAHAGQAIFPTSFESAFIIGTKLSFAAREGLVIEASANYLDVDKKVLESQGKSFKGTSLLGHINYMLPLKTKIQPYIGGAAGVSLIGKTYNSPTFTYGGTLGFFINVARDSKMYVEATQLIIDSGNVHVDINPVLLKVGLGVAFGNHNDVRSKQLKKRKKRMFKPIRKRPQGNRERRKMRREYR